MPAPELRAWAFATFIEEGAPLRNTDHEHLQAASVEFLWTNCPNARQGRVIIGQAELGTPRAMGAWAKARAEMQVREWFGSIPDFIVTIFAQAAKEGTDAEFCALVEHELYHCGQAIDAFGLPKFTKEGRPVFTMRGHDVEEFVGVVRRYGAKASHSSAFVEAAINGPAIAPATIARACGTCQRATG